MDWPWGDVSVLEAGPFLHRWQPTTLLTECLAVRPPPSIPPSRGPAPREWGGGCSAAYHPATTQHSLCRGRTGLRAHHSGLGTPCLGFQVPGPLGFRCTCAGVGIRNA